ncbi:MAG: hypothetical protein EXR63_01305 [Dehalococcoidia bacterium]|nr:hypothetical protein [Dehalococcoidia bacterium]
MHASADGLLGLAVADGVSSSEGSWAVSATVARAAADWGANATALDRADPRTLVALANVAARSTRAEVGGTGSTTLAAAALDADGWVLASVGDSALISVPLAGPARSLTPLDQHPRSRHVLLAWIDGDARPTPHVVRLPRTPGWLCLLTDGITAALDLDAIAEHVRNAGTAAAATALVEAARAAARAMTPRPWSSTPKAERRRLPSVSPLPTRRSRRASTLATERCAKGAVPMADAIQGDSTLGTTPSDRRGHWRGAGAVLGALGQALVTYSLPRCPRCRTDEPPTADAATAAELGASMLRRHCGRCGHCWASRWPQPLDSFTWPA